MSNVKPCPAGHTDVQIRSGSHSYGGQWSHCYRCDTCSWSGPQAPTAQQALELWNTRTEPEPEPEKPEPCMWCGGEMKIEVYFSRDVYFVTCQTEVEICRASGPSRPTPAEAVHDYNEVARKIAALNTIRKALDTEMGKLGEVISVLRSIKTQEIDISKQLLQPMITRLQNIKDAIP